MAFFSNRTSQNPHLYFSEQLSSDVGWCAYVLPEGTTYAADLDIRPSFDEVQGTYLFSCVDIRIPADTLVAAVWNYLGKAISPNRGVLWVTLDAGTGSVSFDGFGFSAQPVRTGASGNVYNITNALTGYVSDTLELQILNNCEVSYEAATSSILVDGDTGEGGSIQFNTISGIALTSVDPNQVRLFFSGAGRGCVCFDLYFREGTDFDIFDFGLKYFVPKPGGGAIAQRYPLFRPDVATQSAFVGFRVWVDFTNIENDGTLRTFFAFTGSNQDSSPTLLPSAFVTEFGHAIDFKPYANLGPPGDLPGYGSALMIFEPNSVEGKNRYLAPSGNFTMHLTDSAPGGRLVCGLSTTESILFSTGDTMRFLEGHAAYSPRFPFLQASPVGSPVDPSAGLLDATYETSWAIVVASTRSGYSAQPAGASLYGRKDGLINDRFPTLLGHRDPAFPVSQLDPFCFPLLPYADLVTKSDGTTLTPAQAEDFERQVIAPTRRATIARATKAIRSDLSRSTDPPPTPENVTTPSGVVATIEVSDSAVVWTKILLGQIQAVTMQQFYFQNPDDTLVQAFQTGQLFMVAANAIHFGTPATAENNPSAGQTAQFYNRIEIGGWRLEAEVGQNSLYGDYRDVFIFKGCKGKLYAPPAPDKKGVEVSDTVSLVANPEKWTQRGDFSSPTILTTGPDGKPVLQPPDDTQQVTLSQWLQDYFQDVHARAADPGQAEYFQNLDAIAQDETWTGILVLKMAILEPPDDLAGITAGITDMGAFNVHHLGIEISQVTPAQGDQPIGLSDSSSMFGLIYYVDPSFTLPAGDKAPVPVQPDTAGDYDFRVLSLQVLFERSTVVDFHSYAQISMNRIFAMPVDHMGDGGNQYNAIILSGAYQNNGGQASYSLRTESDSTFYFKSNIINKVEILGAQMSTRNPGTAGTVLSWFNLSGFIDFLSVASTPPGGGAPDTFDILSFGNLAGQDQLRMGLSFSGLGLLMSFAQDDPADKQLSFVTGEIAFDPSTSTPRAGSLYNDFALALETLLDATAEDTQSPNGLGYLTVITDLRLTGVDGRQWYGLRYRLNMGSPGALAGKTGFSSYLLVAWTPDSDGAGSYQAMVGLELPGTGGGSNLISLQNVLKLSIGQIRLTRDQSQNSFLLMMTDIALRFLGMLKIPPNGSTLFYLFGNPQSQGQPSGLGWYAMYSRPDTGT